MSGIKVNAKLSLNDRFKLIRERAILANKAQTTVTITDRHQMLSARQSSAKNKRLALLMANRPSVMAALRLKRKSIQQRLGTKSGTVKGGLSLGRIQGSKKKGFVTQSSLAQGSRFRLNRSNFTGTVRTQATRKFRGRRLRGGRGGIMRAFVGAGPGPSSYNQSVSLSNQNVRGRGARRGRGNRTKIYVNSNKQLQKWENARKGKGNNAGGFATGYRGRFRGRRRGGRDGRRPQPNRNQLDKDLDAYMAKTKGSLDAELDSYMADAID